MVSFRTLFFFLFLSAAGFAATSSYADVGSCPTGDGKITIYSYMFDELLDVTYRKGKKYDQRALDEIKHLFRCRSDQKEHEIDIKLIELLDHTQDHFQADSIELISGYRSEELNGKLRKTSTQIAENSQHIEGKAADIHIDEVTEESLVDYLRGLKCGGVGYYPINDFVHMDTGDVRKWDQPDKPGRLMMGFRKGAIWQISTDRDLYLPNETIEFEILNITRGTKVLNSKPSLELFRRGKWQTVREIDMPQTKFLKGKSWNGELNFSKDDPFGKYRIVISAPKGFEHLQIRSNEFYRKMM